MPIVTPQEFSSLEREVYLHHLARGITQIKRYPETAYKYGMATLKILESTGFDTALYNGLPDLSKKCTRVPIGGVELRTPIVLAAGMFKDPKNVPRNAHRWNVGAVTIGGITGNPQDGNPGKRLWIYPDIQAAVNCMGLNNPGRIVAAANLRARKERGNMPKCPLILNSCNGTASQTVEDKIAEHVANFETFFDLVEIFEVNISCPNQKGAQAMSGDIDLLVGTLKALQKKNDELAARTGKPKKPIILKIKPDYFDEDGGVDEKALARMIEATQGLVDGYTTTNTTTDRSPIVHAGHEDPGKGGLSGAPLLQKQLIITRTVRELLDNGGATDKIIVSTGGIGTGESGYEIMETGKQAVMAGADAAGVYTGLMLNGRAVPSLVAAGMEDALEESEA